MGFCIKQKQFSVDSCTSLKADTVIIAPTVYKEFHSSLCRMSAVLEFQAEILSWDIRSSLASFQKCGSIVAESAQCEPIPDRFLEDKQYLRAFRRPAILEFQACVLNNISTESLPSYPVSVQVSREEGENVKQTKIEFVELIVRFSDKETAPTITGDMLCALSLSKSLTEGACLFAISLGSKLAGGLRMKALSSKVMTFGVDSTGSYFLHPVASMIGPNREIEALESISSISLREEILFGIGNAGNIVSKDAFPLPPALLTAFSTKLNFAQKEVVSTLCSPQRPNLLLVRGPPGTGKTLVLTATLNAVHVQQYNAYYASIAEAVKSGRISTNERSWLELARVSKPRIVVCAPSNVAIDNIILRIQSEKFLDGSCRQYVPRLVRIGKGSTQNASVAERALSRLIEKLTSKSGKEIVRKLFTLEAQYSEYRHGVLVQVAKMHCLIAGTPYRFKSGVETRVTTNKAGALLPYWADHSTKTTSVQLPPAALAGEDLCSPIDDMEEWIMYAKELVKFLELWEETHWKLQRYKLVQSFIQESVGTAGQKFQLHQSLETLFMNQASVVCGTLNSTGLSQVKDSSPFQTCVVDEAAQAVELSTLIPLKLGVKQLVLVGDPQQLPATVIGKRELLGNYERSLFERLETCGVEVHTLNVQYRMNPAISIFPSNVFYDGKLKDADSVHSIPFFASPPFVLNPFVFVDLLAGRDKFSSQSLSRSNAEEAAVCVSLYFALLRMAGDLPLAGRVGVISPYAEQVRLLKSTFEQTGVTDAIEIATVDSFQGKEKDIIILSTVRACPESNSVGFLADLRRMNVAITRAKHGLFVVGRSETLSVNPEWRHLVDQAKSVPNGYFQVPGSGQDMYLLFAKSFSQSLYPQI